MRSMSTLASRLRALCAAKQKAEAKPGVVVWLPRKCGSNHKAENSKDVKFYDMGDVWSERLHCYVKPCEVEA